MGPANRDRTGGCHSSGKGRCARITQHWVTEPRSLFLKAVATPYNRALHRFAVFTAGVTFLLIVAGALVTSNDAGLSVPDWPTTFGSFYKMPHMVGGVKFEHGHRMVAEFVGLLTICLAIWTWRSEKRPWMKFLGLAAIATVRAVIMQTTIKMSCPIFGCPSAASTVASRAQGIAKIV